MNIHTLYKTGKRRGLSARAANPSLARGAKNLERVIDRRFAMHLALAALGLFSGHRSLLGVARIEV